MADGKLTYQDLGGDAFEKINTKAEEYITKLKKIVEESSKLASGKLETSVKGASDSLKQATDNTTKLSKAQKQLDADIKEHNALIKARQSSTAKLKATETTHYKQILKNRTATQENTKAIKLEQKATLSASGSYDQLSARLSQNLVAWKKLSVQERQNTKQGKDLTNAIKNQRTELKNLDAQTGTSTRNVGNYWGKLGGFIGTLGITTGIAGAIKLFKSLGESVLSNSQTIADSFDIIKAKGKATFDTISRAIANADFKGLADDIIAARAAAGDYTKEQDDLADTMRSLRVETAEVENEVYKLRGIYSVTGGDAVKKLDAVREANKLLLDLQKRRSDVTEGAINSELNLIQKTYDLTEEQKNLVTSYIKDYGKADSAYKQFAKTNEDALNRRIELEKLVNEGTTVSEMGIVKMSKAAKNASLEIESLNKKELKGYDAIQKAVDGLSDVQRTRITEALADQQNQERATQRLINETNRQTATIEAQVAAQKGLGVVNAENAERNSESIISATESLENYNSILLNGTEILQQWEDKFTESVDNILLKQTELTEAQKQAQIDDEARKIKTKESYEASKKAGIDSAYQVFEFAQTLGDRRVADIEAQVAAGTKTEEEGAKAISEIRKKQARAAKAQALVEIAINTGVAISKVLGQTGIFGLAAWIPVAALGAAQAATVLAQPLPAYEKGGHHEGGAMIANEKGRELFLPDRGGAYMLEGDKGGNVYANAPAGTIIPNNVTERILQDTRARAAISIQDHKQEDSNAIYKELSSSIKGLRKDFRKQKTIVGGIDERGFYLAEHTVARKMKRIKGFQE